MDYDIGYQIYSKISGIVDINKAPNVAMKVVIGKNVPTLEKVNYSSGVNGDAELVKGDGDGTVNSKSLQVPALWINKQTQHIQIIEIDGVDHTNILAD